MEYGSNRRCGVARIATVAILAGFVGACADQTGTPAPVYMKGGPTMGAAPAALAPPAPIHREARQITVQRGQSLNGVARDYHVKPAAIVAANHLSPPYELKTGAKLVIPDAGPPAQMASVPAPGPQQRVAAAPLPAPAATAAPGQQPAALTPPPSAAKVLPDIVPLDGPPPKEMAQPRQAAAQPAQSVAANGNPPSVLPPRNPAAALPLPGEAPPASEPVVAAPAASGRFAWPVQGRVLVGYGAASNGGRNDGINIAAPRGTPVRSIESGTVAYVGNEVKGYGNLVLVKHDNGWISAYAHLEDPSVKVGDKVGNGQVIARVGESGGVSQPQLHFELRRGRKPVDPREFLAPAPSAGDPAGRPAG